MPLHVDIRVNDKLIDTVHIGRISGNTDPNNINHYVAVTGEEPLFTQQWIERGTRFTHRYGDGAQVCVMKALQVLNGIGTDDWMTDNG